MRSAPSRWRMSKKRTSSVAAAPDAPSRPKALMVSWNAWGEASSCTPSTSPSSTTDVTGRARATADDAVETIGDVVEVAGVDAHLVAESVDLHAGAVELPLHRRRARVAQRLGDVGGTGGEHRLDRVQHGQPDGLEGLAALGQREHRRAAEVAGEHRGAADDVDRDPGGGGDGVGHHAGQRALAELAGEQAADEVDLGLGGAGEEVGEQRLAGRLRPRTRPCRPAR